MKTSRVEGITSVKEIDETVAGIACDLGGIPEQDLGGHKDRASYLFGAGVRERVELADGFAFRFEAEDYQTITAFIANERLCCPFFHFTLEVTPDSGPIWLRITGQEEVKPLLEATLNDQEFWK